MRVSPSGGCGPRSRPRGPLLDPAWADALRAELGWLGRALGPVRDLDVLLLRLRAETATLPEREREAAQVAARAVWRTSAPWRRAAMLPRWTPRGTPRCSSGWPTRSRLPLPTPAAHAGGARAGRPRPRRGTQADQGRRARRREPARRRAARAADPRQAACATPASSSSRCSAGRSTRLLAALEATRCRRSSATTRTPASPSSGSAGCSTSSAEQPDDAGTSSSWPAGSWSGSGPGPSVKRCAMAGRLGAGAGPGRGAEGAGASSRTPGCDGFSRQAAATGLQQGHPAATGRGGSPIRTVAIA